MYFPETVEIVNSLDETKLFILEMLRVWYRELLLSILVSPVVIWESGLFRNRTVAG